VRLHAFKKTQAIAWLALLVLFGCARTGTVTGKVTYQGRPVRHGTVIGLNIAKSAQSGVIEPDGTYTIPAVPYGEFKIAVVSRDPSKGRSTTRGEKPDRKEKKSSAAEAAPIEGWVPLPSSYEMPGSSGLRCNVDSRSVRYDLELK
jgi:hypothetical protein